jgi:hypothetical protein
MIKNVLKYFIALYLLILVLLVILGLVKKQPGDDFVWPLVGITCLLAALLVIGLFIGMVLSVLLKMPAREKLFYWIGQFVSLSALVWLTWYARWGGKETLTHDAQNQRTIADLSEGPAGYALKLSFDTLRSHFTDPNEFKIDSTITVSPGIPRLDSLTNKTIIVDSTFIVYLIYHFPRLKEGEFYAKTRITGNQIKLEKINEDTKTSAEYMHLLYGNREILKEVEKALKDRK